MKWTKTPPRELGWYWFRNRTGGVGIVEVDAALMLKARQHFERYASGETDFALDWAGPLQPPCENEEPACYAS
jgi:hypothetical protein